jgi:hypothetical protein
MLVLAITIFQAHKVVSGSFHFLMYGCARQSSKYTAPTATIAMEMSVDNANTAVPAIDANTLRIVLRLLRTPCNLSMIEVSFVSICNRR